MKNSRQHPRKSCTETTFFATRSVVIEGFIKNISRRGVFIQSLLALPVGQTITLAVPADGASQSVKCRGKVVWTNEEGFGVELKERIPV
jgi:Tfp pilus assembly protein PilZ